MKPLATIIGLITVGLALSVALLTRSATNDPPLPKRPQLESAKAAIATNAPATNAPTALTPQAAFVEGVRIGALLGRRNPDMDESMLALAANRLWREEMARRQVTR